MILLLPLLKNNFKKHIHQNILEPQGLVSQIGEVSGQFLLYPSKLIRLYFKGL